MDIYTGQVNCERWPVDRLRGWNAGLTNPGPMCGRGRSGAGYESRDLQ